MQYKIVASDQVEQNWLTDHTQRDSDARYIKYIFVAVVLSLVVFYSKDLKDLALVVINFLTAEPRQLHPVIQGADGNQHVMGRGPQGQQGVQPMNPDREGPRTVYHENGDRVQGADGRDHRVGGIVIREGQRLIVGRDAPPLVIHRGNPR